MEPVGGGVTCSEVPGRHGRTCKRLIACMGVRIKERAKGALGITNLGGSRSVCVSVGVLACAARGWCCGRCRGGRAGGGGLCEGYQTYRGMQFGRWFGGVG